jgi:hypothetical protein
MSIPMVERKRFTVGKYDIIAQPIPHSAHMLRYTVFVDGKRIGAMASMPGEADCQFLEKPPIIPPLVPYQATYRPGRPKKGTPPRAASELPPAPREELPHGLSFPVPTEER